MKKGGTGVYWNPATCCWEAWAVNVKTGEERFLSELPAEIEHLSPDAKPLWEQMVWGSFLANLGVTLGRAV